MGKHLILRVLLTSVCLVCFTSGYVIDTDSCTGATATWLKGQIDCAFNIISDSADAINDPNPNQGITNLLNNLIGTSTDQNYVTPNQAVLSRFDGTNPPGQPSGMTFNHAGILSMREEQTGTPSASDVKFYCNTDRFVKLVQGDNAGRYVDGDLKELINAEQGNPLKDCDGGTMAYTYVSDNVDLWSTVTLCPWFLNYAQKSGFPQCGTLGEKFKGLTAKALDGIVTSIKFTPIDLFSLFDKVIVHELTHTRAGGQTWDAKMDPNGGEGIGNLAYGFKNCNAIRDRKAVFGDSAVENTPQNNADTFAIFASGTRLINNGGSIDNNGKITKPTTNNSKRWPLIAMEFES